MTMVLRGKAWKVGKNVDTDVIIPAKYVHLTDPVELGKHCLEGADPEFSRKVARGDLVVADSNFGCGSSREMAPIAIKGAGISAVIAKSFARIFFRNAINIGLPIFECPEAASQISQGHEVEIEAETGKIRNLTTGATLRAVPLPPFVREIVEKGGLMRYVTDKLIGS
jgi:3-isopropylmalate/(R)-2-methylmalate dehydratase small subunit